MAMETHNRVVYEGEPTRQEERREEIRREETPRRTFEEQPRAVYEEHPRARYEERERPRRTYEKAAGGSSALVGFAGVAAIVLAILGLVGIAQPSMAAISAIIVGAALLIEGGVLTSWFSAGRERVADASEGGASAEIVSGIAGIVLGVLALVGIAASTLLPVAVLTLGASLFLASWGGGVTGAKMLIGIAGIVLGVLALMGTAPLVLTLVGFLVLGCATFMSGSFFAGKFMSSARA